jgi:superfamily II DNA/RNA helicase
MKHNGFILADVVGLGKTVIACMVIKKFIYENGPHTKVLVVVPPALEANWRRTANEFQIWNHFEFVTIGSLHHILDEANYTHSKADQFDLIVVDESHKFRNDYTEMYLKLQEICKMPRAKPSEDGDSRKKVILISATPLNNRPQDIENQLYLFQDRRNSTLEGIKNLQDYFKSINEQYKKLSSEQTLNIKKLKRLFQKLRDDVIEPLVIRRTRTDIENNPAYLEDLESQGIVFPKIADPVAVYYYLENDLSTLFLDTISLITGIDEDGSKMEGLGYYRYRAIEFLAKESDKKIYGDVNSISSRLSGIMKVLLVKRLESSFYAFKQSLNRFQKAINHMLKMFDSDRVFIAPDLDINRLLEDGLSYDEIEQRINKKGGNNREFRAADFDKRFYILLLKDKDKVDDLIARWNKVTIDPKLAEFVHQVRTNFFDPEKNYSGKLVIFSESKETTEELSAQFEKLGGYKALVVNADNRKAVQETLRQNFDANLEQEKWKDDYDIVITTEVLAEGINLHRSNVIVNYDVPWNSTRLMQRIGRVNRIGSQAGQIFVYNFYPSAHGDAQIQLVNTALRKLQAFHTAFGEDNRVFSLLEEKGEGALFGNKIQEEESEILKYLNELRDFKKKNPKRFLEIAAIPNKARCGRKAENLKLTLLNTESDEIQYPLAGTSLSYLKSDNHPGIFCLVTPDLTAVEISFLKAVKIFKASPDEGSLKLHSMHHQQAIAAMKFFRTERNQENIQSITRTNLSPAENKAITNINALIKVTPNDEMKTALQRTLEVIKQGTFASKGLPREINDFFKKNDRVMKTPDAFVELLFKQVLNRYNSLTKQTSKNRNSRGIINPKIVLTQSFS